MLNIKTGIIARPLKGCIYGPEGLGKSTLASQFPDPLFIDTEGGTTWLDVKRFNVPESWDEIFEMVQYVIQAPDICKTLVIDTADWAEQLCIEDVCKKHSVKGIEDFGYGRGYVYLQEEFQSLLDLLNQVREKGIHVFFIAHAKMRKFEQPDEMGAYDRWEMKLTKQVAPLLKEWCDLLLFCNYKTYVVQSDSVMEKAKVQGGKRVMYTSHHPCWDAKNRHGLPDELPLEFKSIAHLFTYTSSATVAEKPIDTLRLMMTEANVTEADIRKVVSERGHYPADTPITDYTDKFISGWIIKYWPKVQNIIKDSKNKEDSNND